MFKLLRRISVGVFPRPDRPWDEDPTSNAPRTSRKRRLSSPERSDDDEKAGKKVRGDTATPSVADADATFLVPISLDIDAKEVKEVTKGVREVELEDTSEEVLAAPETIPLPEETSGELDDPASDDVDNIPEPMDDARTSGGTGSTPVAVEESPPTPPLTEDGEGLKHDEEVVEEEPTADVAEPTNVKKS